MLPLVFETCYRKVLQFIFELGVVSNRLQECLSVT